MRRPVLNPILSSQPPAFLRAILLLLAAQICFASLDATAKYLTGFFAIPMLVWARYSLHLLLMLIFLLPTRRRRLYATRRPGLQLLRAALLLCVTGLVMAALRLLPLAEGTAISFIAPSVIALLAGPWLGEKVGFRQWLALVMGFVGVMLIARPSGNLTLSGVLFALGGALCYSIYQLLTRQLSSTEDSVTMLFYTALVGTAATSLALPWLWQGPLPAGWQIPQVLLLGVLGGFGHFLLIRAVRLVPVSSLSPFLYLQLVFASLMGWLVFRQWPDGWSLLGMAVIVASGLVSALRRPARN